MNEELLKQLYEGYNLSSVGSFDEFKTDMQSEATRKAFFEGYGLNKAGAFEDFQSELVSVKQPFTPNAVGQGRVTEPVEIPESIAGPAYTQLPTKEQPGWREVMATAKKSPAYAYADPNAVPIDVTKANADLSRLYTEDSTKLGEVEAKFRDVQRKKELYDQAINYNQNVARQKVQNYVQQRIKELSPLAKTQEDVDRLNKTLDTEVQNLAAKLAKEVSFNASPQVKIYEESTADKIYQSVASKSPEERASFGRAYEANKQGFLSPFMSKLAGTIAGQIPAGFITTAADIGLRTYDDLLAENYKRKYRLGTGLRPDLTRKAKGYGPAELEAQKRQAAIQERISEIGQAQYEKEKQQYDAQTAAKREEAARRADVLTAGAEGLSARYASSTAEIKDLGTLTEYISGGLGQIVGFALPGVAAGALTGGSGTAAMIGGMAAMAPVQYKEAKDEGMKLLQEKYPDLTREQLFQKNLDQDLRSESFRSAVTTSLLEQASNMFVFGKFIPKNKLGEVITKAVDRLVSNKAVNVAAKTTLSSLGEGTTEWLQKKDSRISAILGANPGMSLQEATTKAMEYDDSEDFWGGFSSAGPVSLVSNLLSPSDKKKNQIETIINNIADTGNPGINQQIDDEANDQEGQIGVPSAEQQGQAPIQEGTQPEGGTTPTETGGVLQVPTEAPGGAEVTAQPADIEATAKALEGKDFTSVISPQEINDLNKQLYNNLLSKQKELINNGVRDFENNEEYKKIKSQIDLSDSLLKNDNRAIAEAYHKAKVDGTNPQLVQHVEQLIGTKPEVTAQPTEVPSTLPLFEQVSTPENIRTVETNTKSEVDRVTNLDIKAEDGATLNLDGTKYIEGGLVIPVVSAKANDGTTKLSKAELTPTRIAQFIKENASKIGSNNVKVGIYKFPNEDKYSIDLNIVVPSNQQQEALAFGKKAGQESLYDLNSFKNIKTGATGNKTYEFTDDEFKEIASAFAEGRTPNITTKETKAGVEKTQDKEADVLMKEGTQQLESSIGVTPTADKDESSIRSAIAMAQQALQKLGIKIETLTAEQYTEKANKLNADVSKGMFVSKEGKIYLNYDLLVKSIGDGRVIWHEASHPVINIIRNTDRKLYDKLIRGLRSAAKSNEQLRVIDNWVNDNYKGQETLDDEFIVETIAHIADGRLDISNLDGGIRQTIVDFINKIANLLGLGNVLSDTDVVAFKNLTIDVADALVEGRDVSKIVGEGNVSYGFDNRIQITANEVFNGILKEIGINVGTVNSKTGKSKVTNFDVAKALKDFYKNKFRSIRINDFGAKALDIISNYATDEVIFALSKFGSNSGKGWYTEDFRKALDLLKEFDNEISDNQDIRDIATVVIAIASNSTDVYTNLKRIVYAVSEFKKTGKIPTDVGVGKGASAISTGIETYNNLLNLFDGDIKALRDFMGTVRPVSESKKALVEKANVKSWAKVKELGLGTDPEWNDNELLPTSVILFGPKIGAFWSNLSGLGGTPTIDRWCIRTMYRYRGDMMAKALPSEIDDFVATNKLEGQSKGNVLSVIESHAKLFNAILTGRGEFKGLSKAERNEKLKPYRKGSQIWNKMSGVVNEIEDGLTASVKNKAEYAREFRSFTKRTFEEVQKKVRARTGETLEISDIQAILWIYEKELFGSMGVKQRPESTYSASAQRLVNELKNNKFTLQQLKEGNVKADENTVEEEGPMGDSYGINAEEFESTVKDQPARLNAKTPIKTGEIQYSRVGAPQLEKITWEKSKEGKGDPSISSRNEIVQQAAGELKEGKITNEEYRATVSQNSPILPITRFFEPATDQEIKNALGSDKQEKINSPVEENTTVGLRLDIPAYRNNNTWVVSVHEGDTNAGKAISYRNVARITDVKFGVEPKAALNIAAGKDKATIGRMFGSWKNIPGNDTAVQGEQAKQLIQDIVNDPNWVQVGMNPFRHSYFYDRNKEVGRPLLSAEEVIQVGGLVYAKNPVYGEWTDQAFTVKGLLDKANKPVQFAKGRKLTEKNKIPVTQALVKIGEAMIRKGEANVSNVLEKLRDFAAGNYAVDISPIENNIMSSIAAREAIRAREFSVQNELNEFDPDSYDEDESFGDMDLPSKMAAHLSGKVTSSSQVKRFVDEWNKENPDQAVKSSEVWNKIEVKQVDEEKIETTLTKIINEKARVNNLAGKNAVAQLKDIADYIRKAIKENKMTWSQSKAIVNRLKNITYLTPERVLKVKSFVDKVAADAQYASKVHLAQKLAKKMRKAPSTASANIKNLAKRLSQVEVNEDNLDDYLGHASVIVNSFARPDLYRYSPVKEADVEIFIDTQNRIKENEITASLINATAENELTISDIDQADSINNPEDAVVTVDDVVQPDKATQTRNALIAIAEDMKNALSVHPITNKNKTVLLSFNPSKATLQTIVQYIKAVNNIILNDNYSGTGKMIIAIQKQNSVNSAIADIKRKMLGKFKPGLWLGWSASLQQVYDQLLRGRDAANEFLLWNGLGDYVEKQAQFTIEKTKIEKEVASAVEAINKKYDTNLLSDENQTRRRVLAELAKHISDPTANTPVVIRNIEGDIKELIDTNNPDYKDLIDNLYTLLTDIRDKGAVTYNAAPVTDPITGEDKYPGYEFSDGDIIGSADTVMNYFEKNHPAVYELWDYFRNSVFTDELYNRSNDINERFYNETMHKYKNYSATLFRKIGEGITSEDPYPNKSLRPAQSNRFKEATRNRRKGYTYSYIQSVTDDMNALSEILHDIYTTESQFTFAESMTRPELIKPETGLFDGRTRDYMFRDYNKRVAVDRKMLPGLENLQLILESVSKTARNFANTTRLFSLRQPISQWFPAYMSLVVRLGGKAHLLHQSVPDSFEQVIALTPAALRDMKDSFLNLNDRFNVSDKTLNGWFGKTYKGFGGLEKASKKLASSVLNPVIGKPDFNIHKRGWVALYIESLQDQGVNDVNLENEVNLQDDEKRIRARQAATFEMSKLMAPSEGTSKAELFKQRGIVGAFVNDVLPFGTFTVNFKQRLITALAKGNTKEGAQELTSAMTEAMVFSAIAVAWANYVTLPLANYIASNFLGMDLEEDEEDEYILGISKKSLSEWFNRVYIDMIPFAVSYAEQPFVRMANFFEWLNSESELEFDEWIKDRGEMSVIKKTVYPPKGYVEMISDDVVEKANTMANRYNVMKDQGVYVIQNQVYGDKEVPMTAALEELARLDYIMSTVGTLAPGELKSAWRKVKKDVERKEKRRLSD